MSILYTFSGITITITTPIDSNASEKFTLTEMEYDDIWTSEVFEHVDEDFSFKYAFVVKVRHLDLIDGKDDIDEDNFAIELFVTVHPDSLGSEARHMVYKTLGCDSDRELYPDDVIEAGGCSLHLGYIDCHAEDFSKHLDGIMSCVPTLSSVRGFIFDRVVGYGDKTGWDVIRYATGINF